MDDLYLDGKRLSLSCEPDSSCYAALGITEEVEALGLKGNRRKKGKKLDDDFNVSSIMALHLFCC